MARLKSIYEDKIVFSLQEQFGYTNKHRVPRISKIVLNMGIGDAVRDKKLVEAAVEELSVIAGQKAVITKAKNSIAGFKLREGVGIGAKVTLRKTRMYEFLDRLVNVAMPRIRDFRGVSPRSFDGRANYNLGIKEHIIFPEIDYDKVSVVKGLDVNIVTTTTSKEEALSLLRGFNLPFREV